MLSYAFTVLGQGDYEEIATEDFENIHNLFAAILSKGINRQLKQGLYREYLNRKEDVVGARGKINMSETIRNRRSRNCHSFMRSRGGLPTGSPRGLPTALLCPSTK